MGETASTPVDADDRDLRVGRFAGRLYGATAALTTLWAIAAGNARDPLVIGFVVACVGGGLMTRLPWDGRGDVLARVTVGMAGVVFLAFFPLFARTPPLLVVPVLPAAYAGAAVDRVWMTALLPGAAAVGWVRVEEVGPAAGLGEMVLYLGIWFLTWSMSVWMRDEVAAGNRALLDAQTEAADRSAREAARREVDADRVAVELRERVEVAGSVRRLVEDVRRASDEVEGQSASIAVSVDQLAGGLRDTSDTSTEAGRLVERIAAATTESHDLIGQLGDAGEQIVGIVDTIADPSEQTNLLALNATIEAARAGEAGKGFAVVANEVKELAGQTARSASGIADVIGTVQQRLTASTEAMDAVSGMVGQLEATQTSLGAAVAEQTEVVGGIAGAATVGAEAVADITRAIRDLDDQAGRLAGTDGSS
ncbi:MAG: methyl-accepting chemotaxis protein [Actinomycetota bacterium]